MPASTAPFAGRTALVTDAGSGIGRATAFRLAADGAAWVGCLDRDGIAARRVADEFEAVDGRADPLGVDVTDAPAVAAAVATATAAHGPIDILINNAGIPGSGRFVDVPFADWQRVLDIHVSGAFHVTQAVLPGMIERRWGRIVNIASEAVWLGNQSVQYVTAKAALVGFTRALAHQVAPDEIRVNAVAPGPVETPMLRDNDPGGDSGGAGDGPDRPVPPAGGGGGFHRVPGRPRWGRVRGPGALAQRRHGLRGLT